MGELVLEGDERILWSRLRSQTLATALTQLLQSLLVAGLVMAVFTRTVTTHVGTSRNTTSGLTPGHHGSELRLVPKSGFGRRTHHAGGAGSTNCRPNSPTIWHS